MADIPDHATWMRETRSLLHSRSEHLKRLDEAIRRHGISPTPDSREAVKKAFDDWRFDHSRRGLDWKNSVRNSSFAMDQLYRAVVAVDRRRLRPEEIEAMRYLNRAQQTALERMFRGQTIEFRSNTLMGLVQGSGSKWERFKTAAASMKEGVGKANEIVSTASSDKYSLSVAVHALVEAACGPAKSAMTPDMILSNLGLGGVQAFVTQVTPVLQDLKNGAAVAKQWAEVAHNAWQRRGFERSRCAFAAGDPEAALDAVLVLVDREIAGQVASATVTSVAFGAGIGFKFLDGGAVSGPVIGVLQLLADVIQQIVEYAREVMDQKAGNELLRVATLGFDLFHACPLLGCYFLVVQDHSTIINYVVEEYGSANFTVDVERMLKKLRPVLERARRYINASRLEIPAFTRQAHAFKGLAEPAWSHRSRWGKLTTLKDHVAEKISERVDEVVAQAKERLHIRTA